MTELIGPSASGKTQVTIIHTSHCSHSDHMHIIICMLIHSPRPYTEVFSLHVLWFKPVLLSSYA